MAQTTNNSSAQYNTNVAPAMNNNQQNVAPAQSQQQTKYNMKLTEAQLKQVIQESVKRVLREMDEVNKEYDDMKKAQEYDKFLGQNIFKRGIDTVMGRKPEKPFPYTKNEPMSARAQRYVDAFNKSHSLGNRVDYDNGESYNSNMGWNKDTYEPVLTQTTYDGSTAAQMRKAYDEAGNEKEWGIAYPYSEFGYTGEYQGDNEDIKRRSGEFNKLRDEVRGKLAQSKKDRDSKKKNESVVRLSMDEFQKFISESVKNVIKEMHTDNFGDDDHIDRIGKRYAEKAKYGYGNLDEKDDWDNSKSSGWKEDGKYHDPFGGKHHEDYTSKDWMYGDR